jgi:hypothetical protein
MTLGGLDEVSLTVPEPAIMDTPGGRMTAPG